ncbi:MAG: hypothetical protein M9894_27945 [Planctomycetes bacterium]|nr:hypothetical protein [Planctomycetota bacterium]
MTPRPLAAALALVALLGGCAPEKVDAPSPERRFTTSRATLRALHDYLSAGYELRLARELEEAGRPLPPGLAADAARLEQARDQLRQSLREDGAPPARVDAEAELLPLVHEGAERGGRYAFIFPPDGDSFAVVRITEDMPEREVILFGRLVRYALVVHDETIVDDYPTWRARRLNPAAAVHRPATYRAEARDGRWTGVVRVDRAAIKALAEQQFLPQVDALRDAARRARDEAAFLALADEPHHVELLLLARATLRWRSLEALWSLVGSRPRETQVARFVEDYAVRAELRAAAELLELGRLRRPGDEAPLTPEERAALFELAALSAMIHGEPLGVAADALALSAASLQGLVPQDDPTALAARRLVIALCQARRAGRAASPGPHDDARDLAWLAGADPEDLRAAATALHAQRARALGQ